jgi:hypothetical protein
MFGVVAAILFAIAFLINATGADVDAVLGPTSLMLLGLVLLALHVAGLGPAWDGYRRRSRR